MSMMAKRKIVFLGASASRSHVHAYFPHWASILGEDATISSYELPIGAPPDAYSEFGEFLLRDAENIGCVITNHKLDAYRLCLDFHFPLEPTSRALEVVSCMRRANGSLIGNAEEVQAVDRAIQTICWRRDGGQFSEVIIFGAGGAGRALAYSIARRVHIHHIAKITVTDTNPHRIADLARLANDWATRIPIRAALVGHGTTNDDIVEAAISPALIINATGLGKDFEGSPVSSSLVFPTGSTLWDLNYRGDLEYLAHGRAQSDVSTHSGFELFVSSWIEALSYIFAVPVTNALVNSFRNVLIR
jgi:shikimate dehydrogenase